MGKECVLTFNSLDSKEVIIYAGIWDGAGGRLWLDDFSIESVPTLNLLRRKSLPLKLISADGGTVFEEGRDVKPISDSKLGHILSWAGTYDSLHDVPAIELAPGSRLQEGNTVLLSGYHALAVPDGQMTCSMSDPKIYEICSRQISAVHQLLQPDGYFLGHDEIRSGGWEADAIRKFKTSGEMFADNIERCFQIANTQGKGKPICVWSDMFDPNHNARKNYYMLNNTITGSWKGLHKDLQIVTWQAKRKSLEFFAGLGNKQILAGYYDQDVSKNHQKWITASKDIEGITGTMFCTWTDDWDNLESYAETWWGGGN